jgi:glycosyltransferase involved in cell wall biosynthesis
MQVSENATQGRESLAGSPGPVLIIAYAYPPENIAGAKRPMRFARYLPQFGRQVSVLTASEQEPGAAGVWHVPDRLTFWVKVVRKLLTPGELGLAWIVPAVRTGSGVVAQTGARVVISTSPPATSHSVALWLKKRHGLRWIADFRDPIAGNPIRLEKAFPYIDRCLEPLIFRYADAVIANTDAVAEMWKSRYGRWKHKIHLIPNGFDPADGIEAAEIPPRPFRVLLHAGSVPPGRYPSPLMGALGRLQRRGLVDAGRLRVQLMGWLCDPAAEDSALLHELQASGLVEILPPVPAAEAQCRICEADFNLLLDMIGENPGLQTPSKVYDYVRIGRPVLAVTTPDSPTERVLEGSGVEHTSLYPGEAAEAADDKLQSFLSLASKPRKPSVWFEQTFNVVEQTRRLARLLDDEPSGHPRS